MSNHRLEINDLIDDAVNNAMARRNETLESVSDEEAKNISGGIAVATTSGMRPVKPIITGKIIVCGIIKLPTPIDTIFG